MTIDAHAHACGELHNIDGIMKYLSDNKLDKVVLCPGEPNNTKNRNVPMISELIKSENLGYRFNSVIRLATSLSGVAKHIDNQNEAIVCLANDYPDKIIQAYWVNPLESNCTQKLESNYLKHNFCVVKMHQCWHNFDILNDRVEKIIQWSLNKRMPVFIHLLSKEQSIKFARLTNRFPNAVFIVGHMIGFEDIIANSKNENVYFDISAPYLIAYKTLEKALNTVGSGRLILGSDTPYGENNIKINISRIKKLGLPFEQQENIMGNNFIKLMRRN